MLGATVGQMNEGINLDLKGRYEKFGLQGILPPGDFDLARDQLIPGRRAMIENFSRIKRHQGEIARLSGHTAELKTGERIDADLIERMQAHAIEGPWAAGERILACIGPDPISPTVVRAAKRLADLMDAPWIAVTVERPGSTLEDAARQRLDDAMKLAQSLGAETQTLTGADLPAELLRFAKFENVTQIVVGRSPGSFFSELLRRNSRRRVHLSLLACGNVIANTYASSLPKPRRSRQSKLSHTGTGTHL